MKELVKPVKEIALLNAEGYCESQAGCSPNQGTCGFNGCSGKAYNTDTTSDEIIF